MRHQRVQYACPLFLYLTLPAWAALPLNLTEAALRRHRITLADQLVSAAEAAAVAAALVTVSATGTGRSSGSVPSIDDSDSGSLGEEWLVESFAAAAKCLRQDVDYPGRACIALSRPAVELPRFTHLVYHARVK